MKTTIQRTGDKITIDVEGIGKVEVDDIDLTIAVEGVIEAAIKKHWQAVPHKHQGLAESACRLCGNKEDRQPHIHS